MPMCTYIFYKQSVRGLSLGRPALARSVINRSAKIFSFKKSLINKGILLGGNLARSNWVGGGE